METSVKGILACLCGPHQREGVVWMCRRESHPSAVPSVAGGILADEMGMGKTHTVVALMRLRPMRTLVVTTLATLMQWQEVLSSRMRVLPLVLRSRDQGCGTGFASARTVLTTYGLFQDRFVPAGDWGRIVLDEAHVVRNPRCRTHRCLSRLDAAHRWVLTGTPVNNSLRDLHALVSWLGAPGLEVDLIRAHLLLRRTKAVESLRTPAAFRIPSLTVLDSLVTLGAAERLAYDRVVSSGRLYATHGGNLRAMEAVLRCRQACTHLSIMDEAVRLATRTPHDQRNVLQRAMADILLPLHASGSSAWRSSAKLSRLVELVGGHNRTEKSLVFCDWLREMDLVEDALSARDGGGVQVVRYSGGMDAQQRQAALRSFESMEDGAALVAQVQCAGTGLNLQCASRVYLMRPSWNPCVERQAIARAHRQGQTRPVVVVRLVAADSIDVRCTEVQGRKLSLIDSVLSSSSSSSSSFPTAVAVEDAVEDAPEGRHDGTTWEVDRDKHVDGEARARGEGEEEVEMREQAAGPGDVGIVAWLAEGHDRSEHVQRPFEAAEQLPERDADGQRDRACLDVEHDPPGWDVDRHRQGSVGHAPRRQQ